MELDPASKAEYGQCAPHILTAVTPIADMALLFGWPPHQVTPAVLRIPESTSKQCQKPVALQRQVAAF